MTEVARPLTFRTMLVVGVVTIVAALCFALAGSQNAQAARVSCGTFTVKHNDHIKKVTFPAGVYNLSANKLSCKQTVKLLQEFLNDPDQILRKPWTVNKNRKFARGKGSRVNFTVTPAGVMGAGA